MSIEVILSDQVYTQQSLIQKLDIKDGKSQITHLKLCKITLTKDSNRRPSLIKQINGLRIQMLNLKVLNLAYNNICSIESIQGINLNSLKELHLFHNCITSLRSLRRCPTPRLRFISFVNNCLVDLRGIEQWNSPKLQIFVAYDNHLQFAMNNLIRVNSSKIKDIIVDEQTAVKSQFRQLVFCSRFRHFSPLD